MISAGQRCFFSSITHINYIHAWGKFQLHIADAVRVEKTFGEPNYRVHSCYPEEGENQCFIIARPTLEEVDHP